jgi:hypothetical protein
MEFPEGYKKVLKEHHGKNISNKTHWVYYFELSMV